MTQAFQTHQPGGKEQLDLTRPSPRRLRRVRGGWWMVIIPGIVAVGMVVYPLLYNLWVSLHLQRFSPNDGQFVGWDNYRSLLRFGDLGGTLLTTVYWTIGSLFFQGLLGLAIALALDRERRGTRLLRTLLLSPWVMPGVVVGAVWLSIYDPISGVANRMVGWVGVAPQDWLGSSHTALPALILANVWKGAPFWMLMISAGLKSISSEVQEAAVLDGASYVQRIRHVVLPGIRDVLVLTTLLAFVWTFNYFDLMYAMTDGGPSGATTTIGFSIYDTSFNLNEFDQGSALSVISFALMLIAILSYMRAARRTR